MTNFSGIGRQGLWSWLTPERAVLVVPVLAGLGLSMALLSVGVTPLTILAREQSKVVEQYSTKAELVPVLRQQLTAVKRKQVERDQQLDRLLALLAGTSELETFLSGLNDLARVHNVAITTTKPSISIDELTAMLTERLQRLCTSTQGRGPRIGIVSMYDVENNAVRILGATLREAGHHVTEIYFKDWISNHLMPATDVELENLLQLIEREKLDLVCVSIRASAYYMSAKVLSEHMREHLDVPILWGGMHPTLMPENDSQQ